MSKVKRGKVVSYNKWGYIFLIPFVVTYAVFQMYPLITTIYWSFFKYYRSGLSVIGPTFTGLANYKELLTTDLPKYALNTGIMWIMGFIPQIVVSLLIGSWFADPQLRLKAAVVYKTIIYLPNLIMASAFSMLFFTLFSLGGPVNSILASVIPGFQAYSFFDHTWSVRSLVAFMNFIMWFGNTTILLMAGMLGIDASLYEAASVDGATPTQVFWRITLPLLRPILVYVLITSMIGGLQMFDVPQILSNGDGFPMRTSMTMIMYLNKHLFSKNYGLAGALSVMLFIITGVLSLVVYKVTDRNNE